MKDKLEIDIESEGVHEGRVKWIAENELDEFLSNKEITKLVYSGAHNYSFDALNWSYSKGDTLESACVILTDGLENLDGDDFSVTKISLITRNKLYVALTRSKGDLYLIKASQFKKYKNRYMD